MPRTSADAPEKGRGWSSRSAASSFRHRIFYLLIRLAGRRAAYVLLLLVVLVYSLKPSVARATRPYLSRRFPGEGGPRLWKRRFRLCFEMGLNLVDRACMGILGPESVSASFPERQDLVDVIKEGRGVIMLTAHVGGWQAALGALSEIEAPVAVVMHRGEGDVDRQFYEHGSGGPPFTVIDPSGFMGGMIEAARLLEQGGVVCIMGDRPFRAGEAVVRRPFLGDSAPFPVGAYKLAATTGAPLAVVLTRRVGEARYEYATHALMKIGKPSSRGPEAFADQAGRFAAILEQYARKRPYQFFNLYDMWRQEQPDNNSQGEPAHG